MIGLICLLCLVAGVETSFARGFGGGGGRVGGGGGGGGGRSFSGGGGGARPSVSRPQSRPSSPSISRPSSRPTSRPSPSISRPSTKPSFPSSRPNTPSSRPSTRPSTPSSRPNLPSSRPSITPGNRPSTRPGNIPGLQPGSRPEIGNGNRPKPLPGSRPEVGARPGTGNGTRPGVIERPGNRPSTLPETRPGVVERPGVGNRPSTLPGLGNRPGSGDRPGIGERPNRPGIGDRPVNRPSIGDRENNINDRLTNRDDRWDNRQDRWDDRRGNWDNWHDHHYSHHGGWHHGHWHGHWHSGSRWNYWWDNYPALTAFGMTTWAVNRVGWAFGYNNYYNPYASSGSVYVDNSTYDYSQPIVMTPDETTLAGDPTSTEAPPEVSDQGMSAFDQARSQFYDGNYEEALKSTDSALQDMPNDTVVHEFRALVTFALGNYKDSAATLYAVLSVGPGWDWTTMSSLYANVDVYSKQLRALEEFCRNNKDDMGCHFVLAYHYTTGGHADDAKSLYEAIVQANPKDQVSQQLLLQIDPDFELPNAPTPVKPPQPTQNIDEKQLVGDWRATRDGGTFEMDLKEDKSFAWTYTTDSEPQKVTGVWGIDEDGILALEMNYEGSMLAQVLISGSKLDFYMLGDTQGSPPLKFVKK